MYFLRKNYILILCIIFWCVITLIRVFNHFPWYDEAHAWAIAQDLNLIEIIKLMKYEGHTILWYSCLMPFAKLNIGYPYSMLLINWLFCFIAILILWFKSPFNNWIKFFISFSFPFLGYFPVVARCYSIGIMFLFMLCALYKDRFKYPNWYALLLILCANTSVMALIGATILGVGLLYKLIRKKYKNPYVYLILSIGAILVAIQLLTSSSNGIRTESFWGLSSENIDTLLKYFLFSFSIKHILVVCALFILCVFFIVNKIFPKFLVVSFSLLSLIFVFVYSGKFWHYIFYYVYLIVGLWLLDDKFKNLKLKFIPNFILVVISIYLIFFPPIKDDYYLIIYSTPYAKLSKIINNDRNLSNANIIYDDASLFPLEFLNENFLNYCYPKLRLLPIYYQKEYCYVENNNYHVDFNYKRLDTLYKNKSYFLLSSVILNGMNDELIIPNENKFGEFIKLKFYKRFHVDSFNYYFYKMEKVN